MKGALEQFLIKFNISLPYDPAVMLLGIYLMNWKLGPHKNQHTNIYSSFTHYCPKPEATKMPFNKCMDKPTVIHPYNEILFSD